MVKQLIATFAVALAGLLAVATVQAGVLENAYLSLGDSSSGAADTTHTFGFRNDLAFLNHVRFEYCVAPSGSCTPAGGSSGGTAATLTAVSAAAGVVGDWTFNATGVNVLTAANTSGTSKTPAQGSAITFTISNADNPQISTCTHTQGGQSGEGQASTGTCYVRVNTYQDSAGTQAADNAIVSLTVVRDVTVTARVDPTFQLTVSGVVGTGQTVNGGTVLTSGLTTTVIAIPFGNLSAGTAKYASHVLTVTSNNTLGYTITAKMDTDLTGTAYGSQISGFGTTGATTTNSVAWTSPTGTTSGTHTGWLGVGTTDTQVVGRNADNQFFTLDTAGTIVSRTTTSASNRAATAVYALEVNAYQQSDNYTGTLTYNALPMY